MKLFISRNQKNQEIIQQKKIKMKAKQTIKMMIQYGFKVQMVQKYVLWHM